LGSPFSGTKAERLVELGGRGIRRAESENLEAASGSLDGFRHQVPAHSTPPERGPDVQVSQAADPVVGGVRVDVEPTNADQLAVNPRGKKRFARPVEAIRAGAPFLDEATDEPQSSLLALSDEGTQ